MPKRLFDGPEEGLGEEILFLESVAAPATEEEGLCDLCWALTRVLRICEWDVSYAWLMGLTGAAFALPLDTEGLTADWINFERQAAWPEAFVLLEVASTNENEPEHQAWREICQQELAAGRPIAAKHKELGWLVIVGLQGANLLVQEPGHRARYQARSPQIEALVCLRPEMAEPMQQWETGLAALRRAERWLEENEERWEFWRDALAEEQPAQSEEERLMRAFACQRAVAIVSEARTCAAEFLFSLAEKAEPTHFEFAEATRAAAEIAEHAATLLEGILIPADISPAAFQWEDPLWRERQQMLLAAAQEADERLLKALQQARVEAGEMD